MYKVTGLVADKLVTVSKLALTSVEAASIALTKILLNIDSTELVSIPHIEPFVQGVPT
jgi:hypothetical protein